MKNYKIAVAGTGYVGLSLGVLFAQHHQVVAVDIVQAKVDMIHGLPVKSMMKRCMIGTVPISVRFCTAQSTPDTSSTKPSPPCP